MPAASGESSVPDFHYVDPDDFPAPVGRAGDAGFHGDGERIVRPLADGRAPTVETSAVGGNAALLATQ